MNNVRFNLVFIILLVFAAISVEAQSTNVEFPTPITSDTISGKIKARDIGDPRSTIYYYVFEATQGDVFLKIEAANLNGDIDIFYADNLRPITKISLYADSSSTQTGREIYLRKPEKLILKVEGKTPNDDAATFSIKFEGSFQAMAAAKVIGETKLPEVKTETETEPEIKVNSVGTIIEVKPKPTPTPKKILAINNDSKNIKTTTTPEAISTIKTPKTSTKKQTDTETESEKKIEVVVTDNLPKEEETEKSETPKEGETETAKESPKPKTTKKTTTVKKTTTAKKTTTPKKETTPKPKKPTKAEELAQALENVRLVVEFKDGAKIERPMNDVIRFGVDKGFLTIVNKDGSIGRYSILEISKISVE